jgi:hypothetical protein
MRENEEKTMIVLLLPKSRETSSVRTRYKKVKGIITGVCETTGDEAFRLDTRKCRLRWPGGEER